MPLTVTKCVYKCYTLKNVSDEKKNWVILELFLIENAQTPELEAIFEEASEKSKHESQVCGSDISPSIFIWIVYNCHVAVCHISIVALKLLFIIFASFKIQQIRFSDRYTLLFPVLNFLAL